MTTTAADIAALRAAARDGDRVAMLLLADVALDAGDDARADSWRWLADPPEAGWEQRAWELLLASRGRPTLKGTGVLALRPPGGSQEMRVYGREGNWWAWLYPSGWMPVAYRRRHKHIGPVQGKAPPGARNACLAACRAALSS